MATNQKKQLRSTNSDQFYSFPLHFLAFPFFTTFKFSFTFLIQNRISIFSFSVCFVPSLVFVPVNRCSFTFEYSVFALVRSFVSFSLSFFVCFFLAHFQLLFSTIRFWSHSLSSVECNLQFPCGIFVLWAPAKKTLFSKSFVYAQGLFNWAACVVCISVFFLHLFLSFFHFFFLRSFFPLIFSHEVDSVQCRPRHQIEANKSVFFSFSTFRARWKFSLVLIDSVAKLFLICTQRASNSFVVWPQFLLCSLLLLHLPQFVFVWSNSDGVSIFFRSKCCNKKTIWKQWDKTIRSHLIETVNFLLLLLHGNKESSKGKQKKVKNKISWQKSGHKLTLKINKNEFSVCR